MSSYLSSLRILQFSTTAIIIIIRIRMPVSPEKRYSLAFYYSLVLATAALERVSWIIEVLVLLALGNRPELSMMKSRVPLMGPTLFLDLME